MADDSKTDRFGGAWLVSEYVFNPDGTFAGIVKQRRYVELLDEGRFRVLQICEPGPELSSHPMGGFKGEWVFDMEVEGDDRHYLGPDVVGMGTQWRPGAMTGAGVWPRFGHEFSSYGVLVTPERQLTGGFFSLAGRSVADIVGVAVPEAAGIEPTLDLDALLPEVGEDWTIQRSVGPMRVALSRPSPQTQRRLWAMHDTVTEVDLRIVETQTAGKPTAVTIDF